MLGAPLITPDFRLPGQSGRELVVRDVIGVEITPRRSSTDLGSNLVAYSHFPARVPENPSISFTKVYNKYPNRLRLHHLHF